MVHGGSKMQATPLKRCSHITCRTLLAVRRIFVLKDFQTRLAFAPGIDFGGLSRVLGCGGNLILINSEELGKGFELYSNYRIKI